MAGAASLPSHNDLILAGSRERTPDRWSACRRRMANAASFCLARAAGWAGRTTCVVASEVAGARQPPERDEPSQPRVLAQRNLEVGSQPLLRLGGDSIPEGIKIQAATTSTLFAVSPGTAATSVRGLPAPGVSLPPVKGLVSASPEPSVSAGPTAPCCSSAASATCDQVTDSSSSSFGTGQTGTSFGPSPVRRARSRMYPANPCPRYRPVPGWTCPYEPCSTRCSAPAAAIRPRGKASDSAWPPSTRSEWPRQGLRARPGLPGTTPTGPPPIPPTATPPTSSRPAASAAHRVRPLG